MLKFLKTFMLTLCLGDRSEGRLVTEIYLNTLKTVIFFLAQYDLCVADIT